MTQRVCQDWGAVELVEALRAGRLDLHDYVGALEQFGQAVEAQVHAWAHQSPEVVALQVQRLDELRSSGQTLPPLYGVPIGVKDNIDTEDYPTTLGWAPMSGRTPSVDAWLVHRLRQAGGIVWGKTQTTELAYFAPTVTCNPRQLAHTPGGSSSGSAAAVAAGMVPVAVGTQTNGSVIRPASFCGVYGFKPTRGLIFNGGVLACSPSLDQVGVFARSVTDLAAVTEVMVGGHEDGRGKLIFPLSLSTLANQDPPLPPKLMFVRGTHWAHMDAQAQAAFEALREELSDCMVEIDLPDVVAHAQAWHRAVMEAEMAANLGPVVAAHDGRASPQTLDLIERGKAIAAVDYLQALDRMQRAAGGFDEFFDHFDAIVTPAALGAAPLGLEHTGDPIMSTVWTFAGLPCLSAPLLQTESAMPLGVQLVGAPRQDARLLRTARWLAQRLA